MPLSYKDYKEKFKDYNVFREHFRKMGDFNNIFGTISGLSVSSSSNMATLNRAELKKAMDKLTEEISFRDNLSKLRTNLTLLGEMPIPGDRINEVAKVRWETSLKNTIEFFNNVVLTGDFDKMMGYGINGNNPPFGENGEKYFEFIDYLNDTFEAGIDKDAHLKEFENYKTRVKENEIKAREELLSKDSLNDLAQKKDAVEQGMSKGLKAFVNAKRSYEGGKLFLRGKNQYKAVGTKLEQLEDGLARLVQIEKNFKKEGYKTTPDEDRFIKSAVQNILNTITELKEANQAYFEHKKSDGQWGIGDENPNANAGRRIKAVYDVDKMANTIELVMNDKVKYLDQCIAVKEAQEIQYAERLSRFDKPKIQDEPENEQEINEPEINVEIKEKFKDGFNKGTLVLDIDELKINQTDEIKPEKIDIKININDDKPKNEIKEEPKNEIKEEPKIKPKSKQKKKISDEELLKDIDFSDVDPKEDYSDYEYNEGSVRQYQLTIKQHLMKGRPKNEDEFMDRFTDIMCEVGNIIAKRTVWKETSDKTMEENAGEQGNGAGFAYLNYKKEYNEKLEKYYELSRNIINNPVYDYMKSKINTWEDLVKLSKLALSKDGKALVMEYGRAKTELDKLNANAQNGRTGTKNNELSKNNVLV